MVLRPDGPRGIMAFALLAGLTPAARAADELSLMDVVRRYADTMIERGRDTYGPVKTGLLLSAMDRMTLAPMTGSIRPPSPAGIRRGDRSGRPWRTLTGANPALDQNLLRVMYTLTDWTGDRKYAQAADEEIRWFFDHARSPATNLLAWGEHLSWDVMTDEPISGGDEKMHEFARPWVLWDRSYELAPESCVRFARGVWEHQIANHQTGGFDRHAPYFEHGPVDGKDFARHGGFYIGTWGAAYRHTRDPVFLTAIETMVARFEKKRVQKDGSMVATIGPLDPEIAAALVPDPLSSRLRAFALQEDELLLASLREPDGRLKPIPATWQAGYSSGISASSAMYYLARYEQVPNPGYRDFIVATAEAYVDSQPGEDVDAWPMSFAHTISTEVAAYKLTRQPMYLAQARRLARLAVALFWQDNPLPRASLRTGHYEAITGPDSLALALLQTYAAEKNLQSPIPSNTIDR